MKSIVDMVREQNDEDMANSREIALSERDAIVSFLRRRARDYEKCALNELADSMQNKPNADRWKERALTCLEAIKQINDGEHWR